MLTEESWVGLRAHLAQSPDAERHDVRGAPSKVLSGLGCRIGELLALDWTRVDDDAGTIAIEGTVVRVPGAGLTVQPSYEVEGGHADHQSSALDRRACCASGTPTRTVR